MCSWKPNIHYNLHKITHNKSVCINMISLRSVLILIHNRDLLQWGRGARTWGCPIKIRNAWWYTSTPPYIFMKCTRTTLHFTRVTANTNKIYYYMMSNKCLSSIVFEYIIEVERLYDRCLQIYFSLPGQIQPWSYILREVQQSITTVSTIVAVTASLVCSWIQQMT